MSVNVGNNELYKKLDKYFSETEEGNDLLYKYRNTELDINFTYLKSLQDFELKNSIKFNLEDSTIYFITINDLYYIEDEEIVKIFIYLYNYKENFFELWQELKDITERELDELLLVFYKGSEKEFFNDDNFLRFLLASKYLINKSVIIKTSKNYFDIELEEVVDIENKFKQYQKVINILHEYYNTDDLLWKFLLLYHIFENFADRYVLVKSIKEKNIKNIEKLNFIIKGYNRKTEQELLEKLFKELRKIECNNSEKDLLNDCLQELEIENFIMENNNKKIIQEFFKLEQLDYIGIIYKIRNSIVHNKEKEWLHLDNNILKENEIIKRLIDEYLLPTMECLIKQIIYKEVILDYPRNYILLWGDEPITEEKNNETN